MADEKAVTPDPTSAAQSADASENKSRIDRLVAAANAAIASGNPLDLTAVAQDLGAEVLASEASIMLGMVQGVITEAQTRQMLQIAEQQTVAKATEAVSAPADQNVAAAAAAAGVMVTAPDNPKNLAKIVPDTTAVAGAAAVAGTEQNPADAGAILTKLGIGQKPTGRSAA